MSTGERLALLVSLVPYLHALGEPVSVTDAAAHFDVPERQIRGAVKQIAVSGQPGESGTYQDLDLFDIDWDALENDDEIVVTRFVALEQPPNLSPLEAATIIGGLHYLRQLPSLASSEVLDRLIAKLARGGAAPITVDTASATEALPVLQDALQRGRRVTFAYRSPTSGDSERTVDPIRLEALDDTWYLRAWCLGRDDERLFLLDRMRGARMLDEASETHATPTADGALYRPGDADPVVTLDVAASALPIVREYLPERDRPLTPGADGRYVVEVHAGTWEHFARLACANAGRIRVIAPGEARDAVADWARRGLAAAGAAGL
ncbi:protein pafC [Pseudoclavibacter endophyticus]|uniref:WYL domain-containing protein n=1 Tax=Pseudoclavibacter endophyticus TaxID=1778590 RepID=A0A6H9WRD1_9MICO|nr:WYL domain-containing protein [Pseudoclavibacter endophyticus]KAB1650191.1 WYL domain-containing protein [Pseudoclavibacter endophyticus]GGA56355.1 protein pafC [Pseudoclavibacter endophyticus]